MAADFKFAGLSSNDNKFSFKVLKMTHQKKNKKKRTLFRNFLKKYFAVKLDSDTYKILIFGRMYIESCFTNLLETCQFQHFTQRELIILRSEIEEIIVTLEG